MLEHVVEGCQCEGKKCSDCEKVLCLGAFYRKKKVRTGTSQCKVCIRAKSRMYQQAHVEQNIQRCQAYYRSHTEKAKAKQREYNRTHREQMREYDSNRKELHAERSRIYTKTYPEKIRAQNKSYSSLHRELRCMYAHKRRALKMQSGGNYTVAEWLSLKIKYDSTCLCCGKSEPEIKLTADHVIPLTKGGTNNIDNIQPLCRSCNSKKYNKIIDYRKIEQQRKTA